MQLITQQQEFAMLCQEIQDTGKIIFMDTEFCRRNTYFAKLSLVQIAFDNRYIILDALTLENLAPLAEILNNEHITKVFHSPDQDFAIFFHLFGQLPKNIFDTQAAAGVIGLDTSLGYARLCKLLLNIQLDKSMQTANWLIRPLKPELLSYAAKDVKYLIPIHRYLANELSSRNLWPNYQSKLAKLTDPLSYQFNPEKILKKIYFNYAEEQKISKPLIYRLLELVKLREEAAIYYNLPRGFCATGQDLLLIAQKTPRNENELKQINLQKKILVKGSFREKLLNLCNAI